MFNYKNKGLVLLASSLLFTTTAQPTYAAVIKNTVTKPAASKLQPKKLTSKSALALLLMKHKTNRYNHPLYMMKDGDMAMPTTAAPADSIAGASESSSTTPISHSDTNIQVQGVDESDIVKVGDDGYIYQVHNNEIRIIKGFPIAELKETATIKFDENFYPSGIYIQNGKLVVLGSSWQNLTPPQTSPIAEPNAKMAIWWGGYYSQISQTRALVYDVSNHTTPEKVRDVAIDGDYLDSRRIGNDLYFVARTYPRYYMMGNPSSVIKTADMLPSIVETKQGKTTTRQMSVNDLSYFPEFVEPDYVVVASLNLESPEKNIVTKAYLGAGELVYSSINNLYLSASKYNFTNFNTGIVPPMLIDDVAPAVTPDVAVTNTAATSSIVAEPSIPAPVPVLVNNDSVTTQIFKFNIDKGAVTFKAAGEVAGTALNQYSMDENGDYFRIATTTQSWNSGNGESHNSLFVLDKDMKTVGRLENLAKGERIYSTRFMGNRAYIVTFKQVDPLFAIDLSIPEKPVVAGELKIPGYSEYLHPYDENHLIGFGHDATTYNYGYGDVSIPLGLKMALFDVSDMNNPKELSVVKIGDKGTNTPLTYNPKALYWDAEKHLFGFPVDLHELAKEVDKANPSNYGNPTWQGAYIYEVTPENGFNLKAKLSQIPDTILPTKYTYDNYSYSYWDVDASNLFVDRILRIDNGLYTLSNSQLSVYDLVDFKEQAKLKFESATVK